MSATAARTIDAAGVASVGVRGVAAAGTRRHARWPRVAPRYGLTRLQPLAALACVAALLIGGFVLTNPLQLVLVLVLIVGTLAASHRLRAAAPYLRFSLYAAAVLIVINPLFSRGGLDVLWQLHLPLFDITITVQGLLFGMASALRLCAVVGAFALYAVALDPDDQLAVMSSVSFRSGLIVSLATRLFPVLSRDAARTADAQRARGVELDRGGRRQRVAARLPLLGALLTQSLERAVDVAESMEARGYGLKSRRAWKRGRRWRPADGAAALVAVAAAAALAGGLFSGAFRYRFFPLLDDPWAGLTDPLWIGSYCMLALACLAIPALRRATWRR